MYGISATSETN